MMNFDSKKLAKIVRDEMVKDGVFPVNPWRPSNKTKDWLAQRGLKIDYLRGTYSSCVNTAVRSWEFEKEGFHQVSIRHTPGEMLIYVPKELLEPILVFGTIPALYAPIAQQERASVS